MTSLYLFRHAHTDFPPELIGGRSNEVPITEEGELQAKKLGQWIALERLQPDFVAVSPAVRTRETARIALEAAHIDKPPVFEDRLQELTKGDAEGQPREIINTPAILLRMKHEQNNFKYENAESNNDAADRLEGWVSEMANTRPEQTVFGFTHGIVTRCLLARYMHWTYGELNESKFDNAAATILQFKGNQLTKIRFNVDTQRTAG